MEQMRKLQDQNMRDWTRNRYDLHLFILCFFISFFCFLVIIILMVKANAVFWYAFYRKLLNERRYMLSSQRWGLNSLKLHRINAKMLGSNSRRQKARPRRYLPRIKIFVEIWSYCWLMLISLKLLRELVN